MHCDTGFIVVGTTTRILSGVGHLAVSDRQYTHQRRRLRLLLGDDESRLGVRHDQSSVLEPVHVRVRIPLPGHVAHELDSTSARYVFTTRHSDRYKSEANLTEK